MCQTLLDSAKSNETYFLASGTLLTVKSSEIDISAIIVLDGNTLQKILHTYTS